MTTASTSTSEGWTNTRLDRVATVSARIGWKALTADEYVAEGYAFLATPNIKSDRIDFENVNFITEFRYEESPALKLQVGDVLLVKDGNTLGITNLIRELPRPATVNGSIAVLRSHTMVPAYLRYVLASDFMQGRIAAYRAGMGVPHLFQADIKQFPLPRPPFVQQQAIADYLDTETAQIDSLLEARRRQAKLLVDHRRAVIDGFTVPGALGGQADAETAWPVAKLKRAAAFFADGDWIESPFITTDGIRLIQTGNIGEGTYRDQGFRYISDGTFETLGCTEVLPGDILISRLAGTVGRSCLAPDLGTRMVVSVDVVIMRPVSGLDPAFVVTYLSSSYHLALAELLARGTTMPRLSRSQVGEFPVPMPPLDVQQRVVREIERRLASVNALLEALDLQVARLLERRQALITAAVTGQLEIPGVAA